MKELVRKIFPVSAQNAARRARCSCLLRRIPLQAYDSAPLPAAAALSLPTLFGDDLRGEWEAANSEIRKVFEDVNKAGAVNPGDRRALWYLIRRLRPKSVLEVGTHIGGSTLHIAHGLRACRAAARFISVDRVDVNDAASRPWTRHGASRSPGEMLAQLDFAGPARFVTADSLDYLAGREAEFDFIFLDGDHEARTVYQEIPLALKALRPEGCLLLHDYFPDLKPLWTDGKVIAGPFLAVRRLRREGGDLAALPLGALPWPTKPGSNVTSLAQLARK